MYTLVHQRRRYTCIYNLRFQIETYSRKISVFLFKSNYAIYVLCGCGSGLVLYIFMYINICIYCYIKEDDEFM